MQNTHGDVARVIAQHLHGSDALCDEETLVKLIEDILRDPDNEPTREHLETQQKKIRQYIPETHDKIPLLYGGVTKVKDYVFEAPNLQEIRGASSLLEWVNMVKLPEWWNVTATDKPEDWLKKGIIYASGGNILAFVPKGACGNTWATNLERTYTCHTLTANSVAVSRTFSLLELRYGRLQPKPNGGAFYWFDDFQNDWQDPAKHALLEHYYYPPAGVDAADNSEEALRKRFYNRKTFGELVKWLSEAFYRRRQSHATDERRRDVSHFPLHPLQVKCATSDIRPAVVEAGVADRNPQRSEASAIKLFIGQQMKRGATRDNWFKDAFGDVPVMVEGRKPTRMFDPATDMPLSWEEHFIAYLKDNDAARHNYYREFGADNVKPAQDTGEIAQASTPSRYIGLIYADGNAVGSFFEQTKNPLEYAERARCLDDASKNAVFFALAKHLRPTHVQTDRGDMEWVHPFEIITVGGDDLLLIVPGSAALDIALTIAHTFENSVSFESSSEPSSKQPDQSHQAYQTVERYQGEAPDCGVVFSYQPQVSLSAGVVIAQENAPIFFLRDLVEQLLKSAKEKAKQREMTGRGTVDFMVMKSITMVSEDIRAFRASALGTGEESPRRLTGRPYTWTELQGLLTTVRALKSVQFSRSQLYRIQQRLFETPQKGSLIASIIDYLHARTSIKPDAQEIILKAFDHAWHNHRDENIPPWMKNGTSDRTWHETIWPDLVEIYDFVQQQAQEQAQPSIIEDVVDVDIAS